MCNCPSSLNSCVCMALYLVSNLVFLCLFLFTLLLFLSLAFFSLPFPSLPFSSTAWSHCLLPYFSPGLTINLSTIPSDLAGHAKPCNNWICTVACYPVGSCWPLWSYCQTDIHISTDSTLHLWTVWTAITTILERLRIMLKILAGFYDEPQYHITDLAVCLLSTTVIVVQWPHLCDYNLYSLKLCISANDVDVFVNRAKYSCNSIFKIMYSFHS